MARRLASTETNNQMAARVAVTTEIVAAEEFHCACVNRAAGIRNAQGSEVFVLDTNTVLDYFKDNGRVPEYCSRLP